MVGLLTMTGGASLAGLWVYRRVKEQRGEERWWHAPQQTLQTTLRQVRRRFMARNPVTSLRPPMAATLAPAAAQALDLQVTTINYGLRTSTLALGATTVGWLISPPLQVVGLPLLVYMGIPAAQAAYEQLWLDGRPNRSLAETVILVVGLARGYYWISALGFCCYYGVRHWRLKPPQDAALETVAPVASIMAHCRQEDAVYAVPLATLQPGAQVILQSGEVAPVDGLIVEGVAWMRQQGALVPAAGLRKAVGDRVMAADLVLVGRICVRTIPVA